MGWVALRAIAAATCAVSLLVSAPATAQDLSALDRGVAAYASGNYAVALAQFRLAAAQGEARAQFTLGTMYKNGEGVPQNYVEAVKWYRLAAAQGVAVAQTAFGSMYYLGTGVPQNHAEAMKWFHLAAAQGFAGAQNNLGVMHNNGEGVPQNYAEAVKWYNLAAAQGNADARTNREAIQKLMTPQQIAEAQRLSSEAVR